MAGLSRSQKMIRLGFANVGVHSILNINLGQRQAPKGATWNLHAVSLNAKLPVTTLRTPPSRRSYSRSEILDHIFSSIMTRFFFHFFELDESRTYNFRDRRQRILSSLPSSRWLPWPMSKIVSLISPHTTSSFRSSVASYFVCCDSSCGYYFVLNSEFYSLWPGWKTMFLPCLLLLYIGVLVECPCVATGVSVYFSVYGSKSLAGIINFNV
jgi:hypothetical protein